MGKDITIYSQECIEKEITEDQIHEKKKHLINFIRIWIEKNQHVDSNTIIYTHSDRCSFRYTGRIDILTEDWILVVSIFDPNGHGSHLTQTDRSTMILQANQQ